MRPVELQIVLALVGGPLHGYGIVTALRDQSDGAIDLEPGNLYRVLHRLVQAGLVCEVSAPAGEAAERRRYYRVTALGERTAAAELERLRRVLTLQQARVLMREAPER